MSSADAGRGRKTHGIVAGLEQRTVTAIARRSFSRQRLDMRKAGKREFSVIVERDAAGYYVASVPELPGCHTQARSLDKLLTRVREAVELCLEMEQDVPAGTEFIGVQRIAV